MEDFLEENIEGYYFEKNIFSKEVNRLWIFFGRNGKGLRDIYLFIRILQQEKNGNNFNSFFPCSVNEISYKSLLCKSQVKKYVRSLIKLGLVERKIVRKVKMKNNEKVFETSSLYKVKRLTEDIIYKAYEKKVDAVVLLEVNNYKYNLRSSYYEKGKQKNHANIP